MCPIVPDKTEKTTFIGDLWPAVTLFQRPDTLYCSWFRFKLICRSLKIFDMLFGDCPFIEFLVIEVNMSLQNKIVVVTGGATGIGFALAQTFSDRGAVVVIGSRRQSAIDEAIHQSGSKLHGKTVDVGNRDDVNEFVAWVEATHGPVDVLINAAGSTSKIAPWRP